MLHDTKLRYSITNESLPSIVKGLNLQQTKGNVFAICGSGDQALAMLEYADQVTTGDFVSSQLDFIKRKVDLISTGNYEAFINTDFCQLGFDISTPLKYRNKYFTRERFERIKDNIEQLTILEDPINLLEDPSVIEGSNKVYLSNILSFEGRKVSLQDLDKFGKYITSDSLVYISDALALIGINGLSQSSNPLVAKISRSLNCIKSPQLVKFVFMMRALFKDEIANLRGSQFSLDEKLTKIARKYEYTWNPGVYRKQ